MTYHRGDRVESNDYFKKPGTVIGSRRIYGQMWAEKVCVVWDDTPGHYFLELVKSLVLLKPDRSLS